MVFQEHALLPWRTVRDNVDVRPREPRRAARGAGGARAARCSRWSGSPGFARHYPHQLSGRHEAAGGHRPRAANDPEVLLMDEPLAALDAQTRTIMQEELLRIWATLGKTVIYVTHSLEEALLLGDRSCSSPSRPGSHKPALPGQPRPAARARGARLARLRRARSRRSGRSCARRSSAPWPTTRGGAAS